MLATLKQFMSEDVNNSCTFGFAYPTNLVVLPGFAARFMYSIISRGINNHEWDCNRLHTANTLQKFIVH